MKAEIEAVLDIVNSIRATLNLQPLEDLPKGEQENYLSCPLAIATSGQVDTKVITFEKEVIVTGLEFAGKDFEGRYEYRLPIVLQDFVNDFDEGLYPEYILSAVEGYDEESEDV
jgi:hypothetical protein